MAVPWWVTQTISYSVPGVDTGHLMTQPLPWPLSWLPQTFSLIPPSFPGDKGCPEDLSLVGFHTCGSITGWETVSGSHSGLSWAGMV